MKNSGGVRCWGSNDYGQLGISNTTNMYGPPSVDVLTDVIQIAAGAFHTCAITRDQNGLRCWGDNFYNQLGLPSGTPSNSCSGQPCLWAPLSQNVLTGVSQVAGGYSHTCAIMLSNGGVRCWGYMYDGELGTGSASIVQTYPATSMTILTGVLQVSSFYEHNCALLSSSGEVSCWGLNQYGGIGDGTTTNALSPTQIGLEGVIQVAAGGFHTCALMSSLGGVRCWGWNFYGQLGTLGNATLRPPSSNVLTNAVYIAAGMYYSCAIVGREERGVQCWGSNIDYELGALNIPSPVGTVVMTGVEYIATGFSHVCALMNRTLTVRCWGDNTYGQLGIFNTAISSILGAQAIDIEFL